MLIAIVLTLCPVLAFGYVIRAAWRTMQRAARRAAWNRLADRVAAEEAAQAPAVDNRPVYHPVQLDSGLLKMMQRDGFTA